MLFRGKTRSLIAFARGGNGHRRTGIMRLIRGKKRKDLREGTEGWRNEVTKGGENILNLKGIFC